MRLAAWGSRGNDARMPYIPKNDRTTYDPMIGELSLSLSEQPADKRKGHANYVITQILRQAWGVQNTDGESYSSYADIIGTLECAKHEIYRRWVGPYEDTAIQRHGDL